MNLGDASTSAEHALEAAIGKIAAWRGMHISYERIPAGITNLNWRISVCEEGRDYFMKLPGPNTSTFIDRKLAREAAIKVAATGYAPRVVHYLDEEDIEVQEFLDGFRSCNVSDLMDPVIRGNVVDAYRQIHRSQSFSKAKTGFDQLAERVEQSRSHGATLPRDIDALLRHCDDARNVLDRKPLPLCACYNDGYVSNYMIDSEKNVRIIDWEYAGNNDPYWDLAMLAFENHFSLPVICEMIERYDGQCTASVEARVRLYGGVIAVTWGCWALLQACISSIPFDFAKYADLIFLRARFHMNQASWTEALSAV